MREGTHVWWPEGSAALRVGMVGEGKRECKINLLEPGWCTLHVRTFRVWMDFNENSVSNLCTVIQLSLHMHSTFVRITLFCTPTPWCSMLRWWITRHHDSDDQGGGRAEHECTCRLPGSLPTGIFRKNLLPGPARILSHGSPGPTGNLPAGHRSTGIPGTCRYLVVIDLKIPCMFR
jgi:hypothetical protein